MIHPNRAGNLLALWIGGFGGHGRDTIAPRKDCGDENPYMKRRLRAHRRDAAAERDDAVVALRMDALCVAPWLPEAYGL